MLYCHCIQFIGAHDAKGISMNITVIIAEYNPLHNGHLYHIEKTRETTNADAVAVIMSGNFVERGEPAILNKSIRARHAIECGADIVIELPCLYATSAAKYFAEGAIRTAMNIKGAKHLSFGSECGDIDTLKAISDITHSESFNTVIKESLANGNSYPIAHEKAIKYAIKSANFAENALKIDTKSIISPNNILGLEYISAIKRLSADITPITIKRTGSGYHDDLLQEDNYPSATAIRKAIGNKESFSDFVPETTLYDLKNAPNIDTNRLFAVIAMRIIDNLTFDCYEDNEGIINRVRESLNTANDLDELIRLTHTKRYTLSRIKRVLLHIALNHSPQLLDAPVDYARVLAVKKDRLDLLSLVKNQPSNSALYQSDLYADKIYKLIGGSTETTYKLQKI